LFQFMGFQCRSSCGQATILVACQVEPNDSVSALACELVSFSKVLNLCSSIAESLGWCYFLCCVMSWSQFLHYMWKLIASIESHSKLRQ
jgi:hypothetical protein